jgi:hypothetical protein
VKHSTELLVGPYDYVDDNLLRFVLENPFNPHVMAITSKIKLMLPSKKNRTHVDRMLQKEN